jgi:hypothetical protein
MKVSSIPCSGVPVAPSKAAGSSVSLYWPVLARVDRDGPAVGGALVAQAQDGHGLAVAGQAGGDVAVLAAVADEGLAEAASPP